MSVVDIIILIFLALGAVAGFKAGVIKKLTDFVGMFVIVVLSFYLKNNLSVIMYENLPFFELGGKIKEIEVINILLYEVIAFIIVFSLLLVVLRLLLMITGIIEKILKATIILSIPSKLLGVFVGLIEMYVYIFVILVILSLPIFNNNFLKDSEIVDFMLNKTPILSDKTNDVLDLYDDVYNIIDGRKDRSNEEVNTEVVKLLLDKDVVTKESIKKLVDRNKLHISDNSIIEEDD